MKISCNAIPAYRGGNNNKERANQKGKRGPSQVSVTLFVTRLHMDGSGVGRVSGAAQISLGIRPALAFIIGSSVLEIESPCTVSWDNNGIDEAHRALARPHPPELGCLYRYFRY